VSSWLLAVSCVPLRGKQPATLAAATAVHEARAGQRVLLVSTDQAHSLGDVLGVAVSPSGQRDPVRVLADDVDVGGGMAV